MAGIAYHPWFAPHGSKNFSDGSLWYNTTDTVNSLYDCVANVGTGNGRPDNKEANLTTIEGQGGVLCYSIPNAKTPTYKHQEEVKRNLIDGYIENGVELVLGGLEGNGTTSLKIINIPERLVEYGNGVLPKIGDKLQRIHSGTPTIYTIVALVGIYGVLDGDVILIREEGTALWAVTNKSSYLASSGSQTIAEVLADPTYYTDDMKSLLASGDSIGLVANLVDDGGNSNIPDGVKTTFKLQKKVTDQLQVLKSTDSGATWATESVTFDSVANTVTFVTAPAVDDLIIVSNKSMCQSAIPVSTPKPIEVVDRDLIASNHHSVYAYNGLTYAGSGKIATGGSVESKSVEDAVQLSKDVNDVIYVGAVFDVTIGNTIFIADKSLNGYGLVYERTGGDSPGFTVPEGYDITYSASWELKGIGMEPTHNTIQLDNQSIVATKALVTQTANATQVFTQEISSGWDGTSTFEDGVTTGLVTGTTYKEITSGKLYVAEADTITVATESTWSYPAAYNDTATFKQLTDGTTTDSGANTIQTKVLYKASSVRI